MQRAQKATRERNIFINSTKSTAEKLFPAFLSQDLFFCFIQFGFKNSQLSWAQILQLFFRVLSRALTGEMHCYPKKYRSLQLRKLFISQARSRTMIFCVQTFNCIYSCFAFSVKGKSLAIHLAHGCSAPERKKISTNIFAVSVIKTLINGAA